MAAGKPQLPPNLTGAWPASYSVEHGDVPVDLSFLRCLPANAISDLDLGYADDMVPASLPALSHLAPGLRDLALGVEDLDDAALAVVARLPQIESLQILDGTFTAAGLSQLAGLRQLQRLHIEMDDLQPSWFAFAADMPNLTEVSGPDEGLDQPWDAAQVTELRRMLPGVQVC